LKILKVEWPVACAFCGSTGVVHAYASSHPFYGGEYVFICMTPHCQERARDERFRRVKLPALSQIAPTGFHLVGKKYAVTSYVKPEDVRKRREAAIRGMRRSKKSRT